MSGALIGIRLEGVMAGVSISLPSAWIELVVNEIIVTIGTNLYTLVEYYGEYNDDTKDISEQLAKRETLLGIDIYLAQQMEGLSKHISKKASGSDYQLKIVDLWGTRVDGFIKTMSYLKELQGNGYWIEVDL